MKIAVGSDHAGYETPGPEYKPGIMDFLKSLGHDVVDCGTNGPEPVDYPDFAKRVSEAIMKGEAQMGVLICGTGIGIAIAANRFPGIRAAVCTSPEMARIAREHNEANVVAVGRRILSLEQCLEIVKTFLETPFSGAERHKRRVGKMG
ncbi:MAG: ribose 5-phosphate isomerase B [Candidatus Hydrogenedentes bacterium]|nr:ribose 5-phosphate isomerase B [Candidatus Hydrogenedentota bacterium]